MSKLLFILTFFGHFSFAQKYSSFNIHSHNDYLRASPFHMAYNYHCGSIEADVFLHNHKLLVGHTLEELKEGNTIQTMYLDPLQEKIRRNGGLPYDKEGELVLMIDLKTDGDKTLKELIKVLDKYPDIVNCKTLKIVISGNVPNNSLWPSYPPHIFFDARPSSTYNDDELRRVHMFSDNYHNYLVKSKVGESSPDEQRIKSTVQSAHQYGKKFRFWATPDNTECWSFLIQQQVDFIATDHVEDLHSFLTK